MTPLIRSITLGPLSCSKRCCERTYMTLHNNWKNYYPAFWQDLLLVLKPMYHTFKLYLGLKDLLIPIPCRLALNIVLNITTVTQGFAFLCILFYPVLLRVHTYWVMFQMLAVHILTWHGVSSWTEPGTHLNNTESHTLCVVTSQLYVWIVKVFKK